MVNLTDFYLAAGRSHKNLLEAISHLTVLYALIILGFSYAVKREKKLSFASFVAVSFASNSSLETSLTPSRE